MTESLRPEGIRVEGVSHAFDDHRVLENVSLDVGFREIVTLLGPSGCGKTTMLRLIAGLERLQTGRIVLDGRVLADADTDIPPEERAVGFLFQDFALFPHLTVLENVMFGLSRWPSEERRARALHVLDQVGMTAYVDAYPHRLSGGQQQRVALARARGPRPRMLLMDEPFSSLDTTLRRQVRDVVLWVLQNSQSSTLMVTHDPEEAMFMSDRIAVMNEGRIVQFGTPDELYGQPADPFVVGLFGEVNRLEGPVVQGHIETVLGRVCAPNLPEGAIGQVLVRDEGVRIDPDAPRKAKVLTARMVGRATLVHLDMPGIEGQPLHVHARLAGHGGPGADTEVGLRLDDRHVFVFPKP